MLDVDVVRRQELPLNRPKAFEDLLGVIRKSNMSVDAVAAKANVGVVTIEKWLDGRTVRPRMDTFLRVAEVLGYDVALVKKRGLH